MTHVAKYGHEWLDNFYQRPPRLGELRQAARTRSSCPPTQRDPFGDLRDARHPAVRRRRDPPRHGAVHAPTASSTPPGSCVIKTAQPYGAFAKTMLERQDYPDLRLFPGGPPEPPYDVTGHTLWMLTGVDRRSDRRSRSTRRSSCVKTVAPVPRPRRRRGRRARISSARSRYGAFKMVARAAEGERAGLSRRRRRSTKAMRAGTWVIPSTRRGAADRREGRAASSASRSTGVDRAPAVDGVPPEARTRKVGLWQGRRQHAGRLADVDARAVRHQPRGR